MKLSISGYLRSLRFRIFLIVFLSSAIPALILTKVALIIYEKKQTESDISAVISQAQTLNNQIATTGFMENPDLDYLTAEFTAIGNANGGRIMVINSSLGIVYDTYGVDAGRQILWSDAVRAVNGETVSYFDRKNQCIIVTVPIPSFTRIDNSKSADRNQVVTPDGSAILKSDANGKFSGALMIIRSELYIANNLSFMRDVALEILFILFFVSVLLAIFISDRVVSPVKKTTEGIVKAREDPATESMPELSYTEIRQLIHEFNEYHRKMKEIDASRSEFVSNVSHELKTPLASMKVLADSINSMGDGAPIEIYRDFMKDITHEIDRENSVINDLLSLVRLDRAGVSMNIAPVIMNDMLEHLLKMLKPLAEKSEVDMVLESFRPVTVEADETKLNLALMNLVENGIKYNHSGGFVHVSLNADHRYCYIKVEDSGIGIPADSIDHIFERFYRVDKSHSREIGGTGLGLAITWNVIMLHHGEIKVSSIQGSGTEFDVRLPLKYIEEGTK